MADGGLTLLRILHCGALLGLFGWVSFPQMGLRGLTEWTGARCSAPIIAVAAAAPVVSVALMLVSVASMMGQSIAALERSVVVALMGGTDMGRAFLVRLVLLLCGLVALLLVKRYKVAPILASVCFGGAIVTLGWMGHAATHAGALGLLHRMNNAAHGLAAGLWLGAIGWFLHLTIQAFDDARAELVGSLLVAMRAFGRLGIALVAVVSATGLLNAHLIFGLEHSALALTTGYGQWLVAKIVLLLLMLVFATRNAGIAHRNINHNVPCPKNRTATTNALRNSLTTELALGLGIIIAASILGQLSPATLA